MGGGIHRIGATEKDRGLANSRGNGKGTELYIAVAREKGWGHTQQRDNKKGWVMCTKQGQQERMGNVHKTGTTIKDG